MTIEQKAQRCLEARGYLVISTFEPCSIGEVIENVDWRPNHEHPDRRAYKMVVIAETDEQDQIEQARIAGFTRWRNPHERPRYFRVVAE